MKDCHITSVYVERSIIATLKCIKSILAVNRYASFNENNLIK